MLRMEMLEVWQRLKQARSEQSRISPCQTDTEGGSQQCAEHASFVHQSSSIPLASRRCQNMFGFCHSGEQIHSSHSLLDRWRSACDFAQMPRYQVCLPFHSGPVILSNLPNSLSLAIFQVLQQSPTARQTPTMYTGHCDDRILRQSCRICQADCESWMVVTNPPLPLLGCSD